MTLVFNLNAQGTEDFESPGLLNQTSFTNNGQQFSIITNEAGVSVYDIETFVGGGWNGTGPDNQFIDNSTGTVGQGDGTSFTIKTTDGADITIKSFYLLYLIEI